MAEPPRPVSVDTDVVTFIVREGMYSNEYATLLADYQPSLTLFVRGELAAGQWNRQRQARMRRLLAGFAYLESSPEEIIDGYTQAVAAASSLGIYRSMGTDLWIVGQTIADRLPLVSHDSNSLRTASRAGLTVFTFNERALELMQQDQVGETRR